MANTCSSSNEYPSIISSVHSETSENMCRPSRCASRYSSIESSLSEFPFLPQEDGGKLDYEKFKKLLLQPSTRTGENIFDYLVEVIQRTIDERPVNVVDYFEQFSRNARKNKLPGIDDFIKEPQFFQLAKSTIEFIKPFDISKEIEYLEEFQNFCESNMTIYQSSDTSCTQIPRTLSENENVFQIQHLWASCGLGFHIDEVFQLSLSVQKVQLHQHVENARFWGRIFGLKESYYVVEAMLTRTEIEYRFNRMKASVLDEMKIFISRKEQTKLSDASDLTLIPGSKWQNYPKELLKKMQLLTLPVPQLQIDEMFHSPVEPVGSGLNRRIYFVTTSLNKEWQELPLVAPEHIRASKQIRKYLTGDLDASLDCYPLFLGVEKHYLRAMIARITSGTYIAPIGCYRRMTRKEKNLVEKTDEADEEEFESEDEDNLVNDNDSLITKNIEYSPLSLEESAHSSGWVHVRPNILNQGRVLHINEELAIKDLEKKALLSMRGGTINYEELDEQEFENEELQEDIEEDILTETGPRLFSSCSEDKTKDGVNSWISRYTSSYSKINQMVIMRSNVWPGAYSIAFESFCDSIYIGWGSKYVARCISMQQVPEIQNITDCVDIDFEINDPTIDMEEKWRQYQINKAVFLNKETKEVYLNEEMSDISVEVHFDDEDD